MVKLNGLFPLKKIRFHVHKERFISHRKNMVCATSWSSRRVGAAKSSCPEHRTGRRAEDTPASLPFLLVCSMGLT